MNFYKVTFQMGSPRLSITVDAAQFNLVGNTATFYNRDTVATHAYTGVESVELLDHEKVWKDAAESLATINTHGQQTAWPCQHTDAVGAEGCKTTTSEVKLT
jgi:hypothetical protein